MVQQHDLLDDNGAFGGDGDDWVASRSSFGLRKWDRGGWKINKLLQY